LAYISVDAYVVWIYKANDMASILNTKGYAVLDPYRVLYHYIIVECM